LEFIMRTSHFLAAIGLVWGVSACTADDGKDIVDDTDTDGVTETDVTTDDPHTGDTDTDTDSGELCDEQAGTICRWAGLAEQAGYNGEGIHRLDSMLYFPIDVEFSPYGKPIVADWNNHKARLLEDDGTFTTIIGTDFLGDGPPDMGDNVPPGAPGTTVNLNHPTDHTYFPDGRLLQSSWHTHKIRDWDPATGLVMVVLGSSPGFAGEDGDSGRDVLLNQPVASEIDDDGNVYLADMRNERVRLWTPDDVIYNLIGTGEQGDSGDGGPGIEAMINLPKAENPEPGGSLAFNADKTLLYLCDTQNHRIRVYDLATGIIDSFAGTGEAGFADGDASVAQFNFPREIEVFENWMYVADDQNHRVRRIDINTGVVDTIAGTGEISYSGDGGVATDATFNRPYGIGIDLDGNVYVSDFQNHVIRVIYM
jgi:WD40 repeat protein